MKMHRVAAVAVRQFYLFRGNPARIVPLFGWVAIDIVLWGFITRYLNTVSSARVNFIPALLGAVLLWDLLVRVMQGVTTAFLEDVWSRNFLNFFASPLCISEYLAGLVISSVVTSVVGLAVMLVIAIGAFGLSYFIYGALLILFFLVLFLFGIALGIAGSSIVLRLGPASEWFVWPIPALVSPFAGVFYPIATLPRWMQWVSYLLPPSYVFEGMRAIVNGRPVPMPALAGSTVLAVGYIVLMSWVFTRVYGYGVRTGLLARYSAESVS